MHCFQKKRSFGPFCAAAAPNFGRGPFRQGVGRWTHVDKGQDRLWQEGLRYCIGGTPCTVRSALALNICRENKVLLTQLQTGITTKAWSVNYTGTEGTLEFVVHLPAASVSTSEKKLYLAFIGKTVNMEKNENMFHCMLIKRVAPTIFSREHLWRKLIWGHGVKKLID